MLCLLLTLLLALGAVPTLGEGAEAVKPPEAGDVVHGFEALEVRDYDALGARLTWFEHQKTGAKLLYIANNDINRAFQLTFRTRAEDDTGVPHVFEHATLYGNEKYPSKSLAMNLMSQTYNTFMTAATDAEMTVYPFSSLSEAQLLSLADFYTESCLHPLIMTDESIFRTQAWHYEMADMDSPLTYNGIVYSEMLGGMTLWETSKGNAYRTTFPGAACGWHCFGDPDHIPELTWEKVKAYHDRYYHPSNCTAFLYGDFEDYAAFLKLLDDAFSAYKRVAFSYEEDGYAPITEPVIDHLTALQAFLANRSGAVSGFAGNEVSIALNRPLADAFFAKLPCVARDYPEYDPPVPAAREAVILDSNVQHNGVLASFAALGVEDDRWLDICARVVQDRLVMPVLREQMGAYGAYCQYYADEGIVLLAHRDPNVAETFDYFGTLPGQIADMESAQDELDGYIMRAYAELARPEGELTGAVSEIEGLLSNISADKKLEGMRQLKAVTPERVKDFAGVIEALVNLERRCTVGSAAAINANAELYDVILNPFAAKD